MKQKYFYIAVGLIIVLAIVSFTPNGDDPITALTKKVNGLQGQVTTLKNTVATQKEDFDQQITDLESIIDGQKLQIKDAVLKSLPVGSVVAFARDATQVPTGWVLCDGRTISDASSIYNGYKVPDLSSHFIRGKGSNENLLSEGGSNYHSHTIPSHTHEIGSHTHSFTTNENRGGSWSTTINYVTLDRAIPNGDAFTNHSQKVMWLDNSGSYDGYHSHSGTTGNASSGYTASGGSGSTGSENNIPKYIALNYIIKIK